MNQLPKAQRLLFTISKIPLSQVRHNSTVASTGCRRHSIFKPKPYATPDHFEVDAKFDKPEFWPLCDQPFKGQGVFRHCLEGHEKLPNQKKCKTGPSNNRLLLMALQEIFRTRKRTRKLNKVLEKMKGMC